MTAPAAGRAARRRRRAPGSSAAPPPSAWARTPRPRPRTGPPSETALLSAIANAHRARNAFTLGFSADVNEHTIPPSLYWFPIRKRSAICKRETSRVSGNKYQGSVPLLHCRPRTAPPSTSAPLSAQTRVESSQVQCGHGQRHNVAAVALVSVRLLSCQPLTKSFTRGACVHGI